jgi:hypothetical protein
VRKRLMAANGKRAPLMLRRVNVEAIEIARMEKKLSPLDLCIVAGVDPAAYRNLIRNHGERSRERVIFQIAGALGLRIRDIVIFPKEREEAA